MSIRLGLPAAAAALLAASSASATTFNFATVAGDVTPITFDGATFTTTNPDPFKFGPNSGLYSTLGATVLASTEADFPSELKITFSTPITSYSLNFALGDFLALDGDDTLTVTPNVGAAKTYTSALPSADDYPQGVISVDAVDVTSLTFTSPEPIIIGNLVTGVPEPLSMAAFGAGLVGLLGTRRRG